MDTVFFIASKLFWALVMPANLAVLLLVAGGAVYALAHRRAGVWLAGLGVGVLCVFGVLGTGHALLYALETRVDVVRDGDLPPGVDGILVLGGAVNTRVSAWSGQVSLNEGADRITATQSLMRRYPDARVVFSGGSGLVMGPGVSEASAMKDYLATVGIDSHKIIFEDQSRNTYENIHNSFNLIEPQPEEVWILVTSAFHMPRSLGIAQKLGWNVMAYPVDYRSQGSYRVIPARLDVLDNLYASNVSIREFIGLLAYRSTGRL